MFDSRVAKFTNDGTLISKWSTTPIERGIAIDSSDNVYITRANISASARILSKILTLMETW